MSLDPIVFVLGAPRSGTTLFRVMLEGHPGLWSPPEMILAPFATMAERKALLEKRFWEKGGLQRAIMDLLGVDVDAARAAATALEAATVPEVYAWIQARLGGRTLVDKCPHLSVMPEAMARIPEWSPNAKFLWIVRHPASVIRSLQNMPMAEVMLQGYPVPAREVWRYANANIEAFLATQPRDSWHMLRYEDLVSNPRPTVEAVAAFLDVPFDEAMLKPYEGDRMREGPRGARAIGDPNMAGYGAIRPEMATKWLEGFDPRLASPETRQLAGRLGYDLSDMPLPPIAAVSDGLEALLLTARELESRIDLPMDLDALEGRRFLLRMLSASLDTFLEYNDADRPEFHHSEGPTRKMFADNPDTDYWRAALRTDGDQVYRVWGRVPPETVYAGVLLYGRGGRIGNRLTDHDLGLDQDGVFEMRISRAPQPGVWLKADGDETAVLVRQYFTDRRHQRPLSLHIERLDPIPAVSPLAAPTVARELDRARRMLLSVFERTLGAYKLASSAALNQFIPIGGEELFPTPDNKYRVCWYRFGHDQLMLVRGHLPKARYFNVALYNAWMESLDYRHLPVHKNHTQIQLDEDGSFELCISHRDLGHRNQLLTGGHHAGYVLARALLPQADQLPELSVRVLYEREYGG